MRCHQSQRRRLQSHANPEIQTRLSDLEEDHGRTAPCLVSSRKGNHLLRHTTPTLTLTWRLKSLQRPYLKSSSVIGQIVLMAKCSMTPYRQFGLLAISLQCPTTSVLALRSLAILSGSYAMPGSSKMQPFSKQRMQT